MNQKKPQHRKDIDYVFSRYPLWLRYSGLPESLGVVAWAVYQRLLELRYRFESTSFFYPIEKLCKTTGLSGIGAMRRILKRLTDAKLIHYKTSKGRGQAAEFEIIEPIKTPIPEADLYLMNPRLRPKSFNCNGQREDENTKSDPGDQFSANIIKSDPGDQFSRDKSDPRDQFPGDKSDPRDQFYGAKSDPRDHPSKRIYIKRQQQQKDPFHDVDRQNSVDRDQNQTVSAVVVALNAETLKEYGIAGEQAAVCLKKYSPNYLQEKIELIEYKRYCGEQIRNPGGMLKKAIEEDWQPPEGFITRAQREEAARRELGAKEAEARATAEKEMRARQQKAIEEAAEAWKKNASEKELHEVHEKARQAVMAENPDTAERWLKQLIRFREERIICEECLAEAGIPGRGG